ncbi:S9 family peptidase [Chryseobacterium sp. RP-3-3]|uniref:S9 family peptidase n=1 Tax=Chryseobacterium antibioticum TaxID=2728847 RepID=A0A7Y0FUD8_9FLAO|nr:prolyl oligopeptidase family serine peptidase [Chryseobacterium antibioticum]NML72434.1 S9 family peptidase [Chryseobacterium antibioticum]
MAINVNRLLILLLIFLGIVCYGTARKDSLQDKASKYYNIAVNQVSDNGEWLVATKVYRRNYDTAMVMRTHKSGVKAVIGTLTKMTQYSFVKDDQLLASGQGRAVLWNLNTGKKKEVKISSDHHEAENITQSGVLEKGEKYFLLTKDSVLHLYNARSELLTAIGGVQYFRVDKSGTKLFIVKKTGHKTELICYADKKLSSLYKTSDAMTSMEEIPSGNLLIVKEKIKRGTSNEGRFQKVVFVDVLKGELMFPDIGEAAQSEYLRFTEIQNGKKIMITGIKHIPAEKGTVDIWYGNDGNLEAKEEGTSVLRYWMWEKGGNTIKKVPSDRFSMVVSLDSPNYFLMFNRDELQNYTTLFPLIHAYIYDLKNDSYKDLGIMQAEISVSNGGAYFLYKNTDERWVLVNMKTFDMLPLVKEDLKKAFFSPDGQTIFFESSSDLWKYDIKTGRFTALNMDHNNEVKILTKKENDLYPETGYNFRKSTVDVNLPVLLSVTKKGSIEKAFFKWDNGRLKKIMASSKSNITWYKTGQSLDDAVYVEESLHYPPRMVYKETGKENASVIFQSNTQDTTSALIRRDIISFKNTDNQPLKGLLYYPIGYTEDKKYPMIVHIYEVQSRNPNQYLSPLNNFPVGFDIKKLLEQGYFVYLPDIVNGSLGVGWSALDCVESSLDALKDHPNVDLGNVGLIGHSFGGYRTNFIATRSNRFKTYISGAGAADLTRMYFSYNETSSTPFYWQFEEGQYNMHSSFAENKKLYVENNPIENVHKVSAPILLWTGMEDKRIVWDQTMEFYIGLKRNKKGVVALFYPGEAHVFTTGSEAEKDLALKIQDWWDYFLKGKKQIPWIEKQMKNSPSTFVFYKNN